MIYQYLDEEDLLQIAERALGGQEVILRDLGLLSMCAHRPQTFAFGLDPYPDLATKAAALLVSLCMNHPLQDGNKRLAWAAALAFIYLNTGELAEIDDDIAFELVMGVASGIFDVPEVAATLREAGVTG